MQHGPAASSGSNPKAPGSAGGYLPISAPPVNGEEMLRPITDEFLERCPDVSVTILLLDRLVNLRDEGVDIAIPIAHLTDSSLVIRVWAEVAGGSLWARPHFVSNTLPAQDPGLWRSRQ